MDCPICSARPGHDEEVSYGSNSFARVSGLHWTAFYPPCNGLRCVEGCEGDVEEVKRNCLLRRGRESCCLTLCHSRHLHASNPLPCAVLSRLLSPSAVQSSWPPLPPLLLPSSVHDELEWDTRCPSRRN